jgi:hypothetical protein
VFALKTRFLAPLLPFISKDLTEALGIRADDGESSETIKTLVVVIGFLAGGIAWAVVNFADQKDIDAAIVAADHVPASEFQEYLEQREVADEREYVLDLKAQIREVRYALIDRPDDEFLLDLLDSLEQEFASIDRMSVRNSHEEIIVVFVVVRAANVCHCAERV